LGVEVKSVRLPESLHSEIKRIAQGNREAMWKTIARAWEFWYTAYKAHFQVESEAPQVAIDKAVWYIFKLVNSVGEFKAGTNKKYYYERLMRTIDTIESRLKIDCSLLRDAAEAYMKRRSKANKTALNDATKYVCVKILESALQKLSSATKGS